MKPPFEQIQTVVLELLLEQTEGWDLDIEELGPDTKLAEELCLASMDMIELMAKIDVHFQRKLPFEQLIATDEGGYRSELSVREFAQFIYASFDAPPPPLQAM